MVSGFEYIKDVWVLEDVCEIGKSYVVIPYEPAGGKTLIAHFGEIIRCRDCKHKPTITKTGVWGAEDENGELEDYACPFLVIEDNNYNQTPNDDDFCSRAERRETE